MGRAKIPGAESVVGDVDHSDNSVFQFDMREEAGIEERNGDSVPSESWIGISPERNRKDAILPTVSLVSRGKRSQVRTRSWVR